MYMYVCVYVSTAIGIVFHLPLHVYPLHLFLVYAYDIQPATRTRQKDINQLDFLLFFSVAGRDF